MPAAEDTASPQFELELVRQPLLSAAEIVARAQPRPRVVWGVYFLISGGEIVYVGQATDVFARVNAHMKEKAGQFDSYAWIPVPFEHLLDVEWEYIKSLNPRLNRTGKSSKHGRPPVKKPDWYHRLRKAGCL